MAEFRWSEGRTNVWGSLDPEHVLVLGLVQASNLMIAGEGI